MRSEVFESPPENRERLAATTLARFSQPLAELSSQIPLHDVSEDIQDFGALISFATYTNRPVPALPIGSNGTRLPIIFSTKESSQNRPFTHTGVEEISIDEARSTFFQGLSSFIAARIAGVRAGRGSGGGPGMAKQRWEVSTQNPGLSIFLAGTHAVREPAVYVHGLTVKDSLLPVFLPMGTLYLGGDSKPNGEIEWDDGKMVTVPSDTPIYYAKKF